jgi:hypothetical protein
MMLHQMSEATYVLHQKIGHFQALNYAGAEQSYIAKKKSDQSVTLVLCRLFRPIPPPPRCRLLPVPLTVLPPLTFVTKQLHDG